MPDLRVARPDTIRTRLEAIRELVERDDSGYVQITLDRDGLISDHAVAALDLLDSSREHFKRSVAGYRLGPTTHRLVPDPERDAK